MKKIINSKKMWLASIIIFISGIIIGLVSGLAIKPHQPSFGFSSAGRFRNRIISNITRQLALNEEQHAQTEKIINAMAEQIHSYQTEQRPKIKAVIDKSMSDIEKLLTPEQLEKFIEMRAKIAKHHSGRRERKGFEGRRYSRDGRGRVPALMPAEGREGEATEPLLPPPRRGRKGGEGHRYNSEHEISTERNGGEATESLSSPTECLRK